MNAHKSHNVFILLVFLLSLWARDAWSAPSLQYILPGSPVTWCDSGCTKVLGLQNVTGGTGKFGDRYDKNAIASATGAMPAQWGWTCTFTVVGTKVPGASFEIYASWSDGTNADGALATTAGTLVSDKRRDLKLLGTVIVDASDATTANPITASGMAWLPMRYFAPAVWNGTGLPTQNVANTSSCAFTPLPFQQQ